MRQLTAEEQEISGKETELADLDPRQIATLKTLGFTKDQIDALRIPRELQEPEEFGPPILGAFAGFFPTMLGMDAIDDAIEGTGWDLDKQLIAKAIERLGFGIGAIIPFALTVQERDAWKRGVAGGTLAILLVTGWKSVELAMDVMAKKKDTRLSKDGETLLKKVKAAMRGGKDVSGTLREEEVMPEIRYDVME